jgi:glycyl-tRNA synthetase (class II)
LYLPSTVRDLAEVDVPHKEYDFSDSIVEHHAWMDEIAIPFGITIDFDSLKRPYSATLRERDSTRQVRIPVSSSSPVNLILKRRYLIFHLRIS